MELIVISESKIKLMLTEAELSEYSGDTREVLREIMEDVRTKCGCGGMKGRIFVQMYPSKGGGCEMFVTKLSDRDDKSGSVCMRSGEERLLAEYRKYIYSERGKFIIYSFENLEYLLLCCRSLSQMNYKGRSRVYADKSKRIYYLLLESETHIAGENFGRLCQSREYCYINEHCDLICESGAVEKLGALA